MLILDGANDKLQLVTSAAADIEVQVSWVENNAGTMTPGGDPMASITTATTTDIIGVAGASKQRRPTHISLRNNHGSTSCDVTVQETDGTNTVTIIKATLLAGESLICNDVGDWSHYDVNAGVYPALGNIAVQSDMEAGSSTSVVVTPGRQHFHPSACKFWANVTGAGTPALTANYNVTSVADTAVGRMTITIATDFASAGWALSCGGIGNTAVTNAAVQWGVSKAAGTIEIDNGDLSATPVAEDPAVGYDAAGYGDHA